MVNTFIFLSACSLTTHMKVAYALDYAKAATVEVANKDLTLLAIFVKMFPFIFYLDLTHTYDLFHNKGGYPIDTL